MRQTILSITLIIVSILLTAAILVQQREGGLGSAFGGGEGHVFRTKRGLEKGLHYVTIALAALFLGIAILNLWIA